MQPGAGKRNALRCLSIAHAAKVKDNTWERNQGLPKLKKWLERIGEREALKLANVCVIEPRGSSRNSIRQ